MNHEKFQSAALAVLCGAVLILAGLIWAQNIAIENVSRAIETLSRTGTGTPSSLAVPPAEPAPEPAPAPVPAP